uniref:Lysosomal-associated transmembrane protein 4B n=1 Tax=Aceria tosichella TaxID=561515 RepID=A0A6G1SFE7_9ACAR
MSAEQMQPPQAQAQGQPQPQQQPAPPPPPPPPPPLPPMGPPPSSASLPPSPTHAHHLNHFHHHPRRAVDLRIPAIDKYAYCLCLHVKPTTIFIAVFKLIRALLFASLLLNTELAINEQGQEVSLSGFEDRHKSTAAAMSILSRIIMAAVSAVGIYAVVSGRAALLMPLYAMLLCEFFFSLPAFYSRDIEFVDSNGLADLRGGQHPGQHPQYTRYSLILFSTIAMVVKIYFLCVVWKCYRLLRLSELELRISPILLSDRYPHIPDPIVRMLVSMDDQQSEINAAQSIAPPPYESVEANTKPPNYEEAMKSPNVFTINIQPSEEQNNSSRPAHQL